MAYKALKVLKTTHFRLLWKPGFNDLIQHTLQFDELSSGGIYFGGLLAVLRIYFTCSMLGIFFQENLGESHSILNINIFNINIFKFSFNAI